MRRPYTAAECEPLNVNVIEEDEESVCERVVLYDEVSDIRAHDVALSGFEESENLKDGSVSSRRMDFVPFDEVEGDWNVR